MDSFDLSNGIFRLNMIDMCTNNVDLIHAPRAVPVELVQPLGEGVCRDGRKQFGGRGLRVDQRGEVLGGCLGKGDRSPSPKREVWLVE